MMTSFYLSYNTSAYSSRVDPLTYEQYINKKASKHVTRLEFENFNLIHMYSLFTTKLEAEVYLIRGNFIWSLLILSERFEFT